MTLEEKEKYKNLSEMMKKIRQPTIDATAFMGNTLSEAKDSLNDLGTTYTNPSFGVERPKIYNNPNLKNTVPVGNLLLGNSDRFFNNLSQGKKPNMLDTIDAATLIPIAGLAGKGLVKGGSNLLTRILNKTELNFVNDLDVAKGITRPQPKIDYLDFLNKPSVFEKVAPKNKNINPNAKIYHEQNTLDGVVKNLAPYEKDLNITLQRVIEKVAPKSEVATRLKLPEKINIKLDSGKKPENISDVLAGRITVDTPDEMIKVANELSNKANVIKLDNYYNPAGLQVAGKSDEGYRAIHMQIENSKGASAEVIIMPKDYMPINFSGKDFYNTSRHGKDIGPVKKLTNEILIKNSKFQRDEMFKKLQNNPKSNLINISPIFPTYRGLLSE